MSCLPGGIRTETSGSEETEKELLRAQLGGKVSSLKDGVKLNNRKGSDRVHPL